MSDIATLEWTENAVEMLPIGARIVVLYEDGSGAWVGCKIGEGIGDGGTHEGEFVDEEGERSCILFGQSFIRLPDSFTLWCEHRSEMPIKLPRLGGAI